VALDSLRALRAPRRDSINNGADDDGSGSMALLEIAEAIATARVTPKRSLLLVWHTGEEIGLNGSEWFMDHPTVPRDAIVAQINLDMIGRGTAADVAGGGDDYLTVLGPRRLSSEYDAWVRAVNARQPRPFALDYQFDADGHPQQFYCRSDHYHYARYGVPIAFFFTSIHEDYHQVTDEPQYIAYPKYTRVTQFLRDLAAYVADQPARPVVDQPRPDPAGRCRQ
jgi:Zn-dependent M28 family amino/carboxypeptidase